MGKKFRCITDFKDSGIQFEAGNSHDLDKLAIPANEKEGRLQIWYNSGWVEVEGEPDPPPIDTHRHVVLEVQGMVFDAKNAEVK